jgi:hypothetical protein
MRRRSQLGLSIIGVLILAAVAAAAYFAYVLVPVYSKDFAIKQAARAQINNLMALTSTHDRAMEDFLAEANRNGVPLTERNVRITIADDTSTVDFSVSYSLPYRYPGTTEWKFKVFRWQLHEKRAPGAA